MKRIENSRRELERYDVILDYYSGTESDNIKGIPELSTKVLGDKNKRGLSMTIKDAKGIISQNTSYSLFPLDRILGISKKINKLELGLEKLMIKGFAD